MSSEMENMDDFFREMMHDHSVKPPEAVWESIASRRTFGHIVLNKIQQDWGKYGMILLLMTAGSISLFFDKNITSQAAIASAQEQFIPLSKDLSTNALLTFENESLATPTKATLISYQASYDKLVAEESFKQQQIIQNTTEAAESRAENIAELPSADAIAALNNNISAAVDVPQLIPFDKHLSDWINAKRDELISNGDFGLVNYYNMAPTEKLQAKKAIAPSKFEAIKEDTKEFFEYYRPKLTLRDRLSLSLAITPEFITKTMYADYNLSSDYIRRRRSYENTRLAFTFSPRINYLLKNGMFLETGVDMTQIYEDMKKKDYAQFSNSYSFISVPLILGYHQNYNQWGWEIKGGFSVQVYNRYRGYILSVEHQVPEADEADLVFTRMRGSNVPIIRNFRNDDLPENEEEVWDLSKEEENPYKRAGVVNIHFATGITYSQSERVTFIFQPYYKRTLNSLSVEQAPFREHIQYMGLSTGARIKF